MLDTSDRRSIRRAEKAARQAEVNRQDVLRSICSTTFGREWLWNWLEDLHVFATPYSTNPYQTFFLLGEQNAGKRLMADVMQFCPDQFLQMMREANARRTERTAADDRADGERSGSEDRDGGVEASPADLGWSDRAED